MKVSMSLLGFPGSPVNIVWVIQRGFFPAIWTQENPLERRISLHPVKHARGPTTFVTLFFAESSCFGHGLSSSVPFPAPYSPILKPQSC